MIFLLRILVAGASAYFLYMLYEWWKDHYSRTIPCPQCDGDGVWEIDNGVETCLLCSGTGKIERVQ